MAELIPKLRPLVDEASHAIRDEIARGGTWVNKLAGHAPAGVTGPSKSTGLSGESWTDVPRTNIQQISITLENDVDYAEYVHFPGADTGQCLEDADKVFKTEIAKLEARLADVVRAELRNLI